jgi:hypothetical protein
MLLSLLVLLAAPAATPGAERGDVLYRMTLLRAAPGAIQDLVDALRPGVSGAAARTRLVLRHSQGDHWDVMVLQAIGGYAEHLAHAPTALAAPALVAWQEDTFVRGPDLSALEGFTGGGLYHIEMFLALADKRADLVREREMENAYLRALGRPTNAIFVRELGGSWDAFTVGAYRGWKHYAEREDIAPERSAAAARAAGFASDDRISPALRALIQSHHDTLATPVR